MKLYQQAEEIKIQKNTNFSYPCVSGTTCYPITLLFPPGRYVVHIWGAQGGSREEKLSDKNGAILETANDGGKGGYSTGILSLLKETRLYLYLGGSNPYNSGSVIQAGGFNGGGNGIKDSHYGCGGGGGSDLRLQLDNMSTRIIVAGGGGGCGGYGSYTSYPAGCGGGNKGGNGIGKSSSISSHGCLFEGGTQTTGGRTHGSEVPTDYPQPSSWRSPSTFGYGASWFSTDGTGWGSGGGGGGWYGGGLGCVFGGSGAGGSGYIFNETSHKPGIHEVSEAYYVRKGMIFGGNTVYGNAGNGYAMIIREAIFTKMINPNLFSHFKFLILSSTIFQITNVYKI